MERSKYLLIVGAILWLSLLIFLTFIPSMLELGVWDELSVSGKRIVDKWGNQVLLRGFNLWSSDIYFSSNIELNTNHFRQVKDWGFNVVKTETWWNQIEPYYAQPGVYNEEALTKLENVVKNAGDAGLYVVISMRVQHESPLQREMFRDNPNLPTAEWVLTTEGLTRFCNMWEMLVQRFDKYPQVIGYNPWHWPFHIFGQPLEEQREKFPIWREGYYNTVTPSMVNAIRRHSSKIIFYSPFRHGFYEALYEPWVDIETGEFDTCPPLADNNVVYMHDGHAPRAVDGGAEWNYDMAFLQSQYQPAFDFSDTHNVPICMAEFGFSFTPPYSQSQLDCLDAKLQLLDNQGNYNWLWWTYSVHNALNPDLTPTEAISVLQAHAP